MFLWRHHDQNGISRKNGKIKMQYQTVLQVCISIAYTLIIVVYFNVYYKLWLYCRGC